MASNDDAFTVYVTSDYRRPELDFYMGLEPLYDAPDVDVTFLDREPGPIQPGELAGADAVIAGEPDTVSNESLAGTDRLRVVGRTGAGFNSLDLDACTDQGVVAVHAPQGPTLSVAQATLGMLISCAHNFRRYDRLVREQGFEGRLDNMGFELSGRTLGIVGLGLIARQLLELLEPFEMDVLACDPYTSSEAAEAVGARLVDLDELLRRSDLVSLHVPLTGETRGMLGAAEFRAMKPTAYLVNTTRGGIYDDATLARAIREGELAGAAIDVFEGEPDVAGNPLLELEDCQVTPHIAGITRDSLTRIGNILSEALLAVHRGEIPRNVLNPEVYDRSIPDAKLSPSYRP